MVVKKIKEMFSGKPESEYIELDVGKERKKPKIIVRPFVLKTFEDTNKILNALREGYTIALVDISPLRSKDIIEVKRAISKIKKTVEALEGEVAGFSDNIIVAVPNFAEIYKGEKIEGSEIKKEEVRKE